MYFSLTFTIFCYPFSQTSSSNTTNRGKKVYTIEDVINMVQVNKLCPSEALRACKYPCTKQVLSYRLSQVANFSPSVGYDIRREKQDDISSLSPFESSGSKKSTSTTSIKKRKRSIRTSLDNFLGNSPGVVTLGSTSGCAISVQSSSSSCPSPSNMPHASSVCPSKPPSVTKKKLRKPSTMVSKERADRAKNQREAEVEYAKALAEGTTKYAETLKNRARGMIGEGARYICDFVNTKYLTEFDRKLTKTTLIRYTEKGQSTPYKRGPPPKVSNTLLDCLTIHSSMMQVSGRGEAKPRDFLAVIDAAIKDTPHTNLKEKYIYDKLWVQKAESLQCSGAIQVEDIRSQWTTYEKLNQWFTDTKQVLLDLKFAEDQQVINEDGSVEELYISKSKRSRIISWDETDHPLSRENDNGGTRSKTYTDPDLPRPGGSCTRGSHHVTAVHGMTALPEVLPPATFLIVQLKMRRGMHKKNPGWMASQ